MFVLACSSDSEGSSGGCGSSQSARCEINVSATVCGDQITMECFDGATPDATAQCQLALEQADEAVYCCASATGDPNPAAAGTGGTGGAPT